MQHLYATCERVQINWNIIFFSKTGTFNLLPVTVLPSKRCCETLSIFVLCAVTCNSATTMNRMHCCVPTAKWFREETTVLCDTYCAYLVILLLLTYSMEQSPS